MSFGLKVVQVDDAHAHFVTIILITTSIKHSETVKAIRLLQSGWR
jgi:hypothetical protein